MAPTSRAKPALVVALPLVACLALSACAIAPTTPEPEVFGGMTLDLEAMRVTTPSWSWELIDCSDEDIQCLEAPGHFLISMQRDCDGSGSWDAGGHRYRVIAPMPHYGLPSASYMSMKYPRVHWYFGPPVDQGYHRWARTADTPGDRSWSTNDTLEEYQVRVVGSADWFRCG